MNDRYQTEFVAPGTLAVPGWIGRGIRLVLGILLLKLFFDLLRSEILMRRVDTGLTSSHPPDQIFFWLLVAWLFWIFPYVVNIGFGVSWRRRPQVVLLATVALTVAYSVVSTGTVWSPALGWVLLVWLLYESFHLGVSFVLSAILSTPGCEMRAIPHLWALLTGRQTAEHFCPSGFLDSLDRWEAERRTVRGEQR